MRGEGIGMGRREAAAFAKRRNTSRWEQAMGYMAIFSGAAVSALNRNSFNNAKYNV